MCPFPSLIHDDYFYSNPALIHHTFGTAGLHDAHWPKTSHAQSQLHLKGTKQPEIILLYS